jgi:hypothetical protein
MYVVSNLEINLNNYMFVSVSGIYLWGKGKKKRAGIIINTYGNGTAVPLPPNTANVSIKTSTCVPPSNAAETR